MPSGWRKYRIGEVQSEGSCAFRDERGRWMPAVAAWRLLSTAWRFVRQVSGDDAYERYGEHMGRTHPGQSAMTREEYYRFRTEQKWNGITRCC